MPGILHMIPMTCGICQNTFLLCFLGATSIFMAGNVGDRRSCQDLPLMGPEGIIADELPQVQ